MQTRFFQELVDMLTNFLPFISSQLKEYTVLNVVITVIIISIFFYFIVKIVKYLVKSIFEYFIKKEKEKRYSTVDLSSHLWGNVALRIPLMFIGTDFSCFAYLGNLSKLIRYIKSFSVLIPFAWSTTCIIILSMSFGEKLFTAWPQALLIVSLIPISILIFDITIVVLKSSKILLIIFRVFSICILSFVFSFIPADFIFSSTVRNHIYEKSTEDSLEKRIADHKRYNELINEKKQRQATLTTHEEEYKTISKDFDEISKDAMQEGTGRKKGSKVNSSDPTKNVIYNTINKRKDELKEKMTSTYNDVTADKERIKTIEDETKEIRNFIREEIKNKKQNQDSDILARHFILIKSAFSSGIKGVYFICILLVISLIDFLPILVSFLPEKEYNDLLNAKMFTKNYDKFQYMSEHCHRIEVVDLWGKSHNGNKSDKKIIEKSDNFNLSQ